MIKVTVKQYGWKKGKIGDILEFDDDMFDELKQAELNGLCSIEYIEIEEHDFEIFDEAQEDLLNKESEET